MESEEREDTEHAENDLLNADDLAAIEESEQQIARGEDLEWQIVRAELRREYLARQ